PVALRPPLPPPRPPHPTAGAAPPAPPPPATVTSAPTRPTPTATETAVSRAPAPAAAIVNVPTDVVISLPEGDEGERLVIASLVRRERDALAKALGVTTPARVSVRFLPTTEAFERTAGHPWFTLGATSTVGELQFVPLPVLRDRGVLERTIRRQLVHLLADGVLTGRPAWVREGAAVHFSEGE